MSSLPEAFESFFTKIELDALAEERIKSAWARLHPFLVDAYGLPPEAVFIQGSTANGTAIKPEDEDGEIDLDIIVHGVGPRTSPADAIGHLRDVLGRDRDLAERLEPDEDGRPCVRLRYARHRTGYGFHIDITPARTGQEDGPLDVPLRGREGWKPTAPAEYTRWCWDAGEPFRRTVRELKRWRDHNDAEIKSITFQKLIWDCLSPSTDDAIRLTETLEALGRYLGTSPVAPVVPNPVLPSEDLALRWSDVDYRKFRVTLGEAARGARLALNSVDVETSHILWRGLLGEDFPSAPGGSSGIPPIAPPSGAKPPNPDRGRQYG